MSRREGELFRNGVAFNNVTFRAAMWEREREFRRRETSETEEKGWMMKSE